jgi:hypothetical protein
VEPRHVARRDLEIDDPHRAGLKHLAVMRFLMHRHHGRLALAGVIRRLPRNGLSVQGNLSDQNEGRGGTQSAGHPRDQRART